MGLATLIGVARAGGYRSTMGSGEVVLRELVKRWKNNSVKCLTDTLEFDAIFKACSRKRMVSVAVNRMMDLEAEQNWEVESVDSIE